MKANNHLFMKTHSQAQVGIGTLLIFIAMVLVAAVAAAVLIQTSDVLQQKAQATGKQASQELSSNLVIKSIEGVRAKNNATSMSSNISLLNMKVGLNVGSSPVDMNQAVISITDGVVTNNLIYANNENTYGVSMEDFSSSATAAENLKKQLVSTQSSPGNNGNYFYTFEKIRDEDVSFSQDVPIMNTGDLIMVYISTVSVDDTGFSYIGAINVGPELQATDLVLSPRTVVNIAITPEAGAATNVDFITPSSYGVKETLQLFP